MNTLQRQCLAARPFQSSIRCTRFLSTSPVLQNARHPDPKTPRKPHDIDPRWLTTTKRRIGKCMMFGLKPAQTQEAGSILEQIARDWRELITGSDGYLTGATRRGLFRQNVAWGEMVGAWDASLLGTKS